MARLRYNGLVAALGGSGLTNSATSVTFAAALTYNGGTAVPTISGSDYIPLTILDASGATVSEIVYLTAYTAAATTGTISRGKEGTAGVTHSAGDKVVNAPTMQDIGYEPSWDDVLTDLSGKVHRWKFDETSGGTVADAIGSLTLTFTGTAPTNYVRNITGPTGLGQAAQFISAHATTAAIGSIPLGAADRTIVSVYRTTKTAQQMVWSYGTVSSNLAIYQALGDTANTQPIGSVSEGFASSSLNATIPNAPSTDGDWHMTAGGMRASGKCPFIFHDGRYDQATFASAVNTTSTSAFRVGQILGGGDSGWQFVGDIADVIVFDRALSRGELGRLYRAFARLNNALL